MFKRVDQYDDESIDGFSYANKDGDIETVTMGNTSAIVTIQDSCDITIDIYKEDIPKLVLALQAAYDFKGN